jgi:hypothetical protein
MATDNFFCKTDQSKPVKQEVNGIAILHSLVFYDLGVTLNYKTRYFRQLASQTLGYLNLTYSEHNRMKHTAGPECRGKLLSLPANAELT